MLGGRANQPGAAGPPNRRRARGWITVSIPMANLIEQAINCNDGERAAKIIRDALGIESDDVANYCFERMASQSRAAR